MLKLTFFVYYVIIVIINGGKQLINLLYRDASKEHFNPTSWGEKDFYYLVYVINDEVYKKVKALSYELEQGKITTKPAKKDQLLKLKRQAEHVRTAYNVQNNKRLKYSHNTSANIPKRF